ncbi:uncharacterized protein LOC119980724 [Tripterygium wilfordii]|uniref:uncharacterized protein LOC119980724 n=1 Tax=Tripterygium wilfordii TaxID=458696 RepID=UPI0018F854D9|nr:uncharacterized protein LOC119980724 [Tripterygium wilfordii]
MTQKLRPYFQTHTIEVLIDQPLKRNGPTPWKEAFERVQKRDWCQRHSNTSHLPSTEMTLVQDPCPFDQLGLDLLSPFPQPIGQRKFLVVATDYFTKWVEAEPLPNSFITRDLVLRKVEATRKHPRKLRENGEGLYWVVKALKDGDYKIKEPNNPWEMRPWNSDNLRKYKIYLYIIFKESSAGRLFDIIPTICCTMAEHQPLLTFGDRSLSLKGLSLPKLAVVYELKLAVVNFSL